MPLLYMGNAFPPFLAINKECFLGGFSHNCIVTFNVMSYYYSIAYQLFISWLTAHSLINYFTLNACVGGVRISTSYVVEYTIKRTSIPCQIFD